MIRKVVGSAMIAAPFVGLFCFGAFTFGLVEVISLFSAIGFLIFWIVVAVRLLDN
jgi:hypothetical protein